MVTVVYNIWLSYIVYNQLLFLFSESKPEINSTYVAITGLVVFGFPVVSMTIFCLLRMQLDKRKRYRNLYVEDKIE